MLFPNQFGSEKVSINFVALKYFPFYFGLISLWRVVVAPGYFLYWTDIYSRNSPICSISKDTAEGISWFSSVNLLKKQNHMYEDMKQINHEKCSCHA
jgi:hypothetical protein